MNKKRLSVGKLGKEMFHRFMDDEVVGISAQLAYFFLLSLFPFMIFLFTLLGYLPISQEDVLSMVSKYAPGEETMTLIESTIESVMSEHRGGLLSLGIIGTIWSASNALNAIVRALNRAYDVKESRPFLVARLMAIILTLAMILVIIVALLLPVFGKAIGVFLFSFFGLSESFLKIWNAMRWIVSFSIMVIVFASLYFFAPNRRLKIREVLIGAVFATLGWQLVSLVFSFYLDNFGNFSATYGSIGGIIVLMIWFYLSAMIIMIGGQLNASIKKLSI